MPLRLSGKPCTLIIKLHGMGAPRAGDVHPAPHDLPGPQPERHQGAAAGAEIGRAHV